MGQIKSQNQLIYSFFGKAVKFDKSFDHPHNNQAKGNIRFLTFTLNNNSGFSLNTEYLQNIAKGEVGKVPINIFYPPPKSNQIIDIISCPYFQNQYYMLVETGEICRYRIEKETGVVEQTFMSDMIIDMDAHPLGQKACTIRFLNIVPSKTDVEISDIKNFNSNIDEPSQQAATSQHMLLALGCAKGSIVFISIHDIKNIYARFSFHRERILQMEHIYSKSLKCNLLISLCTENKLKVSAQTSFAAPRSSATPTRRRRE